MAQNATIMVVEDESVLRTAYEMILKANGFTVISASDGEVGLKNLKDTKPDLVLLDLMMPKVDGKTYLRTVQSDDSYPHCRTIVYSNLYDQATADEVASLGAYRYVLKATMSPADLVRLVNESLKAA